MLGVSDPARKEAADGFAKDARTDRHGPGEKKLVGGVRKVW